MRTLLSSEEVLQGVVQIPLAGVNIVPAALDDGVVEVFRGKQIPCQHLLDLAVRLVPDGVACADALVDAEVVSVPAAVGHHLFQIVHRLHRIIPAAVGTHDPAVPAHGNEVFDVVQIVDELIPGGDRPQGETAEGPVLPGGLKPLLRHVLGIGVVPALHEGDQVLP